MLNWIEENGKHLGFEDGALAYRVYEDKDGWTCEDVQELVAWKGYETAEEAIKDAEADAESHSFDFDIDDEDLLLDLDLDLEETHWDEMAHERMEIEKGLL